MNKVILTVRFMDSSEIKDIEMPTNIKISKIADMLIKAYKPVESFGNRQYHFALDHPPGRWLDPNETLEDAGVWDGAILTLKKNV